MRYRAKLKAPYRADLPDPTGGGKAALAEVVPDISGLAVVAVGANEEDHWPTSLTLTSDATSADRLAAFPAAHVGVRAQVLFGNEVILAPGISGPIRGGVMVATMGRESEARRLAAALRARGATVAVRIVH